GPRGGLILARTDYSAKLNSAIFPGIQGGPLMHVIAAKAVAFKEALSDSFVVYQKNVVNNAKALANRLMDHGIKLVSGGTDNHMMIIDLRNLNITGKDAEDALGHAGMTVNKNSIPFETLSPSITSGIRIGTPAITTRGMKTPEMQIIADLIVDVLQNYDNDGLIMNTKTKVRELCGDFPLYGNESKAAG
ncbi:MAG: serine hydroxymethyltransferase, partial [Deltaproteobacteria bacterium]|nr:serine hydroxymethyltransferase [Deltaproteobacteria bacterium]